MTVGELMKELLDYPMDAVIDVEFCDEIGEDDEPIFNQTSMDLYGKNCVLIIGKK